MFIFDVYKGVIKSSVIVGDLFRIVDLWGIIFFFKREGGGNFFFIFDYFK